MKTKFKFKVGDYVQLSRSGLKDRPVLKQYGVMQVTTISTAGVTVMIIKPSNYGVERWFSNANHLKKAPNTSPTLPEFIAEFDRTFCKISEIAGYTLFFKEGGIEVGCEKINVKLAREIARKIRQAYGE